MKKGKRKKSCVMWANNHQGFWKDDEGKVWMLTLTPYDEIHIIKIDWKKRFRELGR